MKKMKINEIFYSLQGEGYFTGQAAVFVRFALCNLKCPFCDTNFKSYTEMSEDEIIDEVNKYKSNFIVLTGGEPTLQITQSFIDKLHDNGKYITIETNGTNEIPWNIDWITCSPKSPYVNALIRLNEADEIKLVVDDKIDIFNVSQDLPVSKHYYLQPCDTGDKVQNELNIKKCIDYIKARPWWRLSLQTQKILNVR